jgi:hypothetical protein
MAILLFLIHISVFLLLLYFLSAKKKVSLGPGWTIPAFLFKVLMGCLYGYIFLHNYGGDDTWMYQEQSLAETEFLRSHPLQFLDSLIDPTKYIRYSMQTHWQELEYASLIKLLAVLNLFSGGEYYVNVVLFSMISFWGAYNFFRLFDRHSPGNTTLLYLVFFFFIPMVFWTSGIRKDGLILFFSALVFVHFHNYLTRPRLRSLAITLSCLFLLSLQRSVVALILVPILLTWFITIKTNMKPWLAFLVLVMLGTTLFFLSPMMGANLPAMIVRRQAEFFALTGGSFIKLDTLQPNISSFIHVFPQAVNHSLLRPYPGEHAGLLFLGSSIETFFVVAMIITCVVFHKKGRGLPNDPLVLSLLAFVILNYLIIGYTITFIGAILRYRIVAEAVLMGILVCYTDWKRITRIIYK